jgi:heme/copper-type cytochrome/quinol oxidase subunit 4
MIPKKTLYYYVLLMILCVPIIIAVKLGYHIWVNNSTVEGFDFDKAYFVATIISIVIFISNLRSYKDYKNSSI